MYVYVWGGSGARASIRPPEGLPMLRKGDEKGRQRGARDSGAGCLPGSTRLAVCLLCCPVSRLPGCLIAGLPWESTSMPWRQNPECSTQVSALTWFGKCDYDDMASTFDFWLPGYIYTYIYIYIYTHVYVCMCIYIYIYISCCSCCCFVSF